MDYECEQCGGTSFRPANDSILSRQYPFVTSGNLRMCNDCGAKYVICDDCKALLTRVHLSIDVDGVRDECLKCGKKNPDISKWIAQGGGGWWENQ